MKYRVTQWADLRVRIMHTIEVEADSHDEADELATEQIYEECRAAVDKIGYIDDVNWYDTTIEEVPYDPDEGACKECP